MGSTMGRRAPRKASSSPAGQGTSAMTGMPSQLSAGGITITPTRTQLTSAHGGAPTQVERDLLEKLAEIAFHLIQRFPLYPWYMEFLVTATGQMGPTLMLQLLLGLITNRNMQT